MVKRHQYKSSILILTPKTKYWILGLIFIFSLSFTQTLGDLNQDEAVDILDIVRTVNIILEVPPEPTDYELWAGDVNSDEVINVLDITLIVNYLLTGDQFIFNNSYVFMILAGDPKGIYVLNPFNMTYVDSFITEYTISYRDIIPITSGNTWCGIRNIHHPGQNIIDTHIDWIDVEQKEVFQTIEGSNKQIWIEKSHDESSLITFDYSPFWTFSIYDIETGELLGGRDTTLYVKQVRASKTDNIVYIWGVQRNGDGKRLGAWNMETNAWIWMLPYDSNDNMNYYSEFYDMAVSYNGDQIFFRGSDGFGNSKFYDINAQTGGVTSEHYVYGFNQLVPTLNNQYVYLTQNNIVWAGWLEGGGLVRYDIQNNTMEEVIVSLHDLGFNCEELGYFGSTFMSVLPDNQTGIIFASSYCPNDSTWDSHDYIVKIDLENVEFIEGIHMPTTTMPGYQTQHPLSPFKLGEYPY